MLTLNENREKMLYVTLEDFYKNLSSYCWIHQLPNPKRISCSKQLASIGITKRKVGPFGSSETSDLIFYVVRGTIFLFTKWANLWYVWLLRISTKIYPFTAWSINCQTLRALRGTKWVNFSFRYVNVCKLLATADPLRVWQLIDTAVRGKFLVEILKSHT